MNFELLPTVSPFAVVFFVVAAVAALASVAVFVEAGVRNHRTRVAQHATIRQYYAPKLALTH